MPALKKLGVNRYDLTMYTWPLSENTSALFETDYVTDEAVTLLGIFEEGTLQYAPSSTYGYIGEIREPTKEELDQLAKELPLQLEDWFAENGRWEYTRKTLVIVVGNVQLELVPSVIRGPFDLCSHPMNIEKSLYRKVVLVASPDVTVGVLLQLKGMFDGEMFLQDVDGLRPLYLLKGWV
jgi:hypothetical protein